MTKHAAIPSIAELAESARLLVPPTGVIHIGAGNGTGSMHAWRRWSVPAALLIDADAQRMEWAKGGAAAANWQVRTAVLGAATSDEQDFFIASNPAESGLIPIWELASIWPNLKALGSKRLAVERLEELLDASESKAFMGNWVLIDCLPALDILKGAGNFLERWSILWIRAVLDEGAVNIPGVQLSEIKTYLQSYDYRLAGTSEGNHPALGEALFIRDWEGWLVPRLQVQLSQNSEVRQGNDALKRELDVVKKNAMGLEAMLGAASEQRAEMQRRLEEVQAGLVVAERHRDESYEAVRKQKEAYEKVQATARVEGAQLVSDKANLERQRVELVVRLRELQSEVEVSSLGHRDLQTQLDQMRSKLTEAERKLADAMALVGEQRDTRARLEAQLAQASLEKSALEQEISNADHTKAGLEAQLRAAQGERAKVFDQLLATQVQLEQAQAKFCDANRRLTDIEDHAKTQEQARAELEATAKQLFDDRANWQRTGLGLQTQLDALHEDQLRSSAIQKELLVELDQARSGIHEKGEELSEARSQISSLNKTNQDLEIRLRAMEERVSQLNEEGNRSKQYVVEAETKVSEAERRLIDADSKLQIANSEIAQVKSELDQSRKSVVEGKRCLLEMESRLTESDKRHRQLQNEVVRAESQLDLIKDLLLRDDVL